jgi:O-methyltransferase involved in polyketide biosynthesis
MDQWNFKSVAGEMAEPVEIDTSTAHSARVYDYLLGGKDNFPADRAAAETLNKLLPQMVSSVRANRALMHRVVRYSVGEAGIHQILDLGTGIPTSPNVHEIAQGIAPETRVVYVDNDPIVLAHARALLTSSVEGATTYIDADLREPAKILESPQLLATLDLSQPATLIINGTLHFFPDDEQIYGVVRELVAALAPGSLVALQHGVRDMLPDEVADNIVRAQKANGIPFKLRTKDEFTRFFDGLELVPPGIIPMAEWRPDDDPATRPTPLEAQGYAGVGRKV